MNQQPADYLNGLLILHLSSGMDAGLGQDFSRTSTYARRG